MVHKLKTVYNNEVIPYLKENFHYLNNHCIPKITKININRGLGINAQNNKIIKKSIEEFRLITGQHPIITKAKKSIAGFKVREKMELGLNVTLRNVKMYSFLERLIHLTLPRVRDFQGLDPKQFDSFGNFTFGVTDQLIFPEIEFDSVDQRLGFNVTIVTSAKTTIEGLALLKSIGLPFHS
jgi:large subunit ribosomal protein L5